jgi:hypothetical protein
MKHRCLSVCLSACRSSRVTELAEREGRVYAELYLTDLIMGFICLETSTLYEVQIEIYYLPPKESSYKKWLTTGSTYLFMSINKSY